MKKNLNKKVLLYNRDPELYFRVGLRHAGKQMYKNALKFLTEAADKEPYNSDYQFNLACVLAELREVKKSNEIFLNIIKNIDPTFTECYFGVACNYFDSGDFKKARDYFEKYILLDHEGDLVDEAYDVINYLKLYSDTGAGTRSEKTFERYTAEGLKFVHNNEPEKAAMKFEKAVDIHPEAVLQRVLLAFALHMQNNLKRAELLAQSALKLDDESILAQLVLCLIYAAGNRKKDLEESLKDIAGYSVLDNETFNSDCEQFEKLIQYDRLVSTDEKNLILSVLYKTSASIREEEEKEAGGMVGFGKSRVLNFPANGRKSNSKSKRK